MQAGVRTTRTRRPIVFFQIGAETLSVTPTFEQEDAYWIGPHEEIARVIADSISKVRQVEMVCARFSADGTLIWTFLKTQDRSAREDVYRQELDLCERLRVHDLDFRVTSLDIVSPDELLTSGFVQIFKRG